MVALPTKLCISIECHLCYLCATIAIITPFRNDGRRPQRAVNLVAPYATTSRPGWLRLAATGCNLVAKLMGIEVSLQSCNIMIDRSCPITFSGAFLPVSFSPMPRIPSVTFSFIPRDLAGSTLPWPNFFSAASRPFEGSVSVRLDSGG